MPFCLLQINLNCLLEREDGLKLGPDMYKTKKFMNERKKKEAYMSSPKKLAIIVSQIKKKISFSGRQYSLESVYNVFSSLKMSLSEYNVHKSWPFFRVL